MQWLLTRGEYAWRCAKRAHKTLWGLLVSVLVGIYNAVAAYGPLLDPIGPWMQRHPLPLIPMRWAIYLGACVVIVALVEGGYRLDQEKPKNPATPEDWHNLAKRFADADVSVSADTYGGSFGFRTGHQNAMRTVEALCEQGGKMLLSSHCVPLPVDLRQEASHVVRWLRFLLDYESRRVDAPGYEKAEAATGGTVDHVALISQPACQKCAVFQS